MDEKDKQIIKILKDDARAGYGDIGTKVDLSEGAVRKRIKTLTDESVIRKFTVKIGVAEGAQAITLLATNPAYPTQEVSKKIQAIPNVETVYEVTGEYDIVAVISGMNVTEVNECIEKIRRVEGIIQAITLLATNPAYPTQEVSKKIQATPNVETIYEVTGEYDIVAVISGMNVTEVNECIEKIRRVEGIMKTNTMIVLRSW